MRFVETLASAVGRRPAGITNWINYPTQWRCRTEAPLHSAEAKKPHARHGRAIRWPGSANGRPTPRARAIAARGYCGLEARSAVVHQIFESGYEPAAVVDHHEPVVGVLAVVDRSRSAGIDAHAISCMTMTMMMTMTTHTRRCGWRVDANSLADVSALAEPCTASPSSACSVQRAM
jgi:hypothetical protein